MPGAGTGLAIGANQEISAAGRFASMFDFGGTTLTPASGADAFLWRLDPMGNTIYVKQYTGAAISDVAAPRAAALDANGDVLVAGQLHGAYDFGKGVLTSPSSNFDVFVMKVAR
jgi:hypothetical protein